LAARARGLTDNNYHIVRFLEQVEYRDGPDHFRRDFALCLSTVPHQDFKYLFVKHCRALCSDYMAKWRRSPAVPSSFPVDSPEVIVRCVLGLIQSYIKDSGSLSDFGLCDTVIDGVVAQSTFDALLRDDAADGQRNQQEILRDEYEQGYVLFNIDQKRVFDNLLRVASTVGIYPQREEVKSLQFVEGRAGSGKTFLL